MPTDTLPVCLHCHDTCGGELKLCAENWQLAATAVQAYLFEKVCNCPGSALAIQRCVDAVAILQGTAAQQQLRCDKLHCRVSNW